MCYPEFLAAGWPIGDGAVESANKLVVEARLKGSGMHWSRTQVNPMLALRNIVCHDRWDEAWPQIVQTLRQQAQQRRTTAIINATPSSPVPHRHTHLSLPRPNRKQPRRPFTPTHPPRRRRHQPPLPRRCQNNPASSTRSSLATHADQTGTFPAPDHDAAAKP